MTGKLFDRYKAQSVLRLASIGRREGNKRGSRSNKVGPALYIYIYIKYYPNSICFSISFKRCHLSKCTINVMKKTIMLLQNKKTIMSLVMSSSLFHFTIVFVSIYHRFCLCNNCLRLCFHPQPLSPSSSQSLSPSPFLFLFIIIVFIFVHNHYHRLRFRPQPPSPSL